MYGNNKMLNAASSNAVKSVFAVLLLTLCTACSGMVESEPVGEGDASYDEGAPYDPLEGFNRGVFKFNEVVDGVLLKPVAQISRGVVPEVGRKGVHNALSNLSSPVVFANSVLQGDPEQAFTVLWRFILNSTLGVGGLFDFAGYYGIHARDEDFGQTLGTYGAGPGPYLVLPVFGPSNARDAVGLGMDVLMDPMTWMNDNDPNMIRAIVGTVDARAGAIETVEEIYKNSIDPYATIRSGYLQRRQAEVNNHNNPFARGKNTGNYPAAGNALK